MKDTSFFLSRRYWVLYSLLLGGILLLTPLGWGDEPVISSLYDENLYDENTYVYVGGTGPMNYTSIGTALHDVSPGGSVYIYRGEYQESIRVTNSVVLQGENPRETILDGGNNGHVIEIHQSNVTIQGLTICNSGSMRAGVFINASHTRLQDCILRDHRYGIFAKEKTHNYLGNCTFFNNSNGIFYDLSNNNTIYHCNLTNNDMGIYFYDNCWNNTITETTFSHNTIGLFLQGFSNSNSITHCTIDNNNIGARLWDVKKNNFYLNTFIENRNHVDSILGDNIWFSVEKINYTLQGLERYGHVGNYWDDYTGNDIDNDGLGDDYYEVDADDDDRYPIMPIKKKGETPGFGLAMTIGALVGISCLSTYRKKNPGHPLVVVKKE